MPLYLEEECLWEVAFFADVSKADILWYEKGLKQQKLFLGFSGAGLWTPERSITYAVVLADISSKN